MFRIVFKKRCPVCGEREVYRVQRRGWMRVFPGSRYYVCADCRARLFLPLGRLFH